MGSALLIQARERWEGLPSTRRLAIAVIVVGIVGTLALWAFLSSQVPYEVAFQDVKAEEAAAIVDKLRELQIPYQVDDRGAIRVPASMVSEARIRVAGAGLLQGSGVGFEIFNQPSFGLSDFIQQVNYQRALEGELARSIEQLDAVSSARVHLAIPQPSVFVSQQRDPSAAVMVALKPGRQLDRAQSQAIVNLVVGAVDGMKPSGVVLLDTQGHLLHRTDQAGADDPGGVSDQYATQRAMERDLESRLQDLLDRVVGPGHARPQVSLLLDWSKSEATSETYNPNDQTPLIRTSQDIKDVQGPGATVGGVPGVTSNVPTYQQQSSTPVAQGGSERTETNRTYELSRVVEKTQRAPGTIKRVTVSVAVDSSVADAAMVDNLTRMLQAAIGYDPKRGDVVTVVPVALKPAGPADLSQPGGASRQQLQLIELARSAALVVGPILAIVILSLILLRRRPRAGAPAIRTMPVPEVTGPATPPVTVDLPGAEQVRRSPVRERIVAIADRDPALIASILQAWVAEDKRSRP